MVQYWGWWWWWVVTRREVAESEGGCCSEGGCSGRGYSRTRPGEFLDGGPSLFLLLLLLLHLPLHFLFSHWGLLNPRRKAWFPSETEREGGRGGRGEGREEKGQLEDDGERGWDVSKGGKGDRRRGVKSEETDESEGGVGGEMGWREDGGENYVSRVDEGKSVGEACEMNAAPKRRDVWSTCEFMAATTRRRDGRMRDGGEEGVERNKNGKIEGERDRQTKETNGAQS